MHAVIQRVQKSQTALTYEIIFSLLCHSTQQYSHIQTNNFLALRTKILTFFKATLEIASEDKIIRHIFLTSGKQKCNKLSLQLTQTLSKSTLFEQILQNQQREAQGIQQIILLFHFGESTNKKARLNQYTRIIYIKLSEDRGSHVSGEAFELLLGWARTGAGAAPLGALGRRAESRDHFRNRSSLQRRGSVFFGTEPMEWVLHLQFDLLLIKVVYFGQISPHPAARHLDPDADERQKDFSSFCVDVGCYASFRSSILKFKFVILVFYSCLLQFFIGPQQDQLIPSHGFLEIAFIF